MRLLVGGAAAAFFAVMTPASAGGLSLGGKCYLFCDSTPAPATVKAVGAPRNLHERPKATSTPSVLAQRRLLRPIHAAKASVVQRHVVASAPHAIPKPPQPVAVLATPAPMATPTKVAAPITANAADLASANASIPPASHEVVAAPSVVPQPQSDQATHLLAEAFTEAPQPTPTAVPSPEPSTSRTEAVAAPPTVSRDVALRPAGFVEMTANGLVFPWWPDTFPTRAAIWIGALALIAATAFGLAKVGGRRLAA